MPAPWFVTDEHGGNEAKVEVGYGVVSGIEAKDKRSSLRIKDDNPKLSKPVTGAVWNDSPEHEIAVASHAEGRRVAYRIETHRADKIDPAIPFADLGQLDKFRRVVHLAFAPPDTPEPAWFSKTASPQPRQSEAAVHPEAPAASGDDGHAVPNRAVSPIDSWAFLAAVGMVDLAVEVLVDAGQQVSAKALAPLAVALLHAADAAQEALAGHVNRAAQGHTRARGAVRTALKLAPFPGTVEDDWVERLDKTTVRLLRIASDIHEGRVA